LDHWHCPSRCCTMVGVFCDGTAFAHFVPDPEAAPPWVPTASSVSLQTLQNEWDALIHLSCTHCMGVSCVHHLEMGVFWMNCSRVRERRRGMFNCIGYSFEVNRVPYDKPCGSQGAWRAPPHHLERVGDP